MKIQLLFVLSFFCSALGRAQMPVFRQHEVKELGGTKFTAICQDKYGWIWLGAKSVLFRYDGNT
ncbi:MAG TPA: two-component regulator propeller domain-containing protein, partial [Saprospiraceae bacterium]|nr:two-component regulator propeller domain-containing protein [Saprospiraceae bacterium]